MADNIESQVAVNTSCIKKLEASVYGNGQPGIETRIMTQVGALKGELFSRIDQVERHTTSNYKEGDGLLLNELEEEKEARERQHQENNDKREKDRLEAKAEREAMGKKVDRLTSLVAMAMGGLIVLKTLEDLGIIHMVVGK